MVDYQVLTSLIPGEFPGLLVRSTLAQRRPVHDVDRIARMISGANILIDAYSEAGVLIGLARALSDFAYCCSISDLAVDREHQRRGIGRRLVDLTRQAAGPEVMCLLVAAPCGQAFYEAIGMPRADGAFIFPRER